MRSWILKNRFKAMAVATLGLAGAIAGGVWWFTSPDGPSIRRPVIIEHRHDSVRYLAAQAQAWQTCPAAASTCYRWKMTESSGNITDDLSGSDVVLAANGTPNYSMDTTIPMSDGFTRTSIGFDGSTDYFEASDNSVGDQTTNDFTISAWVRWVGNASSTQPTVAAKGATNGWELYWDESSTTWAIITHDGSSRTCSSSSTTLNASGWHFVSVAVDRDDPELSAVHFYMDDAELGTGTCNISTGSLTNTDQLRVGTNAANNEPWEGDLSDVMIADGLMTLAEHQAAYTAFTAPSNVTYTQASNEWKWPLGTGRLGTFGAGNWPATISANLVNTLQNPLGTAFPAHSAIVNEADHPNEIDSWTLSNCTVVANKYEAPDGTMTADEATFAATGTATTSETGAAIPAGDKMCASVWAKKISGDCATLRLGASTGSNRATLTLSSAWQKVSVCQTAADGGNEGLIVDPEPDAACVVALSDAQLTEDNIYYGQCTNFTGTANTTCNASTYSQDWSSHATLMPTDHRRAEVITKAAVTRRTSPAPGDTLQTLWQLGDYAALTEGDQPSMVLKNRGGGTEGVLRGKPVPISTTARTYRAGWDLIQGVPNTSTRRYASLSISDAGATEVWQPLTLNARQSTATIDPSDPPSQKDLNGTTLYVGCDSAGSNCIDAPIESVQMFARPAQAQISVDPTHLVSADFTGPSLLQNVATPRFSCFDQADANCRIFPMADYGGGQILDRVAGTALAESGSPTYLIDSGMLGRGQGRRGANFDRSVPEYVEASATSTLQIGSGSAWSVTVAATWDDPTATEQVFGSARLNTVGGWSVWSHSTGYVACTIHNGTSAYTCQTAAGLLSAGKPHVVTCSWTRSGGDWAGELYVDGIDAKDSCNMAVSGNITNAGNVAVGADDTGGNPFDGQVHETLVKTAATSAAAHLALYKQTIHQGTYWADDDDTVGHHHFNEPTITNGVGLLDGAGQGAALTAVSGTPDPNYRDMPWPAGSGVTRPAIENGTFTGTWTDMTEQESFSLVAWVRVASVGVSWATVVMEGDPETKGLRIVFNDGDGNYRADIFTSEGSASRSEGTDVRDGRWHLIAIKATWESSQWYLHTSLDGAAFSSTATGNTGAVASGPSTFQIGDSQKNLQISGVLAIKDYALTDANIANLFTLGSPPKSTFSYARTSTQARGACFETKNDPRDGLGVMCFGDDQVPYGYSSDLSTTAGNSRMKLAMPSNTAVANLLYQTEGFENNPPWVPVRSTVTANTHISPDGLVTADTLSEDGTAANTHPIIYPFTAANVPYTFCVYLKPINRDWALVLMTLGGTNAYTYVDTSSCSLGSGSGDNVEIAGVSGGWCRACVTGTPDSGTQYAYIYPAEANADNVFDGLSQDSLVVWGAQITATSQWPELYCPGDSAVSTCNAPTTSQIAAADISDWDREEGIILSTQRCYSGDQHYSYDIYNSGDNGRIALLNWRHYQYNSTGTLQQDISNGSSLTGLLSTTYVYDSQETVTSTRRAYLHKSYGTASSSGAMSTYNTDTGANWTQGTGTNLNIGIGTAAGNNTEGHISNVCIWTDR